MPTLDHIILLVSSVSEAVEEFASYGFSVVRGGTHSDGLTENALFIFSNGSYVECIAFLPADPNEPEERTRARETHHWWGKEFGFIDWCLGPGVIESSAIVRAINSSRSNVRYDQPKAGGRRTAQGTQLNWVVSFPTVSRCGPRGRFPFFCEDVPKDSRYLRVPPRVANQGLSLSTVVVLIHPAHFAAYINEVTVVFKASGAEINPDTDAGIHRFNVFGPGGLSSVEITIRVPSTVAEMDYVNVHGDGVYECVLSTDRLASGIASVQSARFAIDNTD